MADTAHPPQVTPINSAHQGPGAHRLHWSRTTDRAAGHSWTGFLIFAATMLMLLGCVQFFEGLTALIRRSYYPRVSAQLAVHVSYTAWGIVHVAIGLLVFVAGIGILAGLRWARAVGIATAGVSAVVNLAFLAAYPWWSVVVIAFDVLVIYALLVHGSEFEPTGP
ncbi:MAG TPA: hypothetical protein VMB79_14170 [Jatrophihabitans sp.]|nr:hypothetical protein [Jatrophihabitans sp.]